MSKKRARTPAKPTSKTPRRLFIAAALVAGTGALAWATFGSTESASAGTITVWKSPTCGCCTEWVAYMRRQGYRVVVNSVDDVVPTKVALGIPDRLQSCHTSKIGDYVVEGHVPASAVARLVAEHPNLKGIALPGMPQGAPGMDGPAGVYRILGFVANGGTRRFVDAGS